MSLLIGEIQTMLVPTRERLQPAEATAAAEGAQPTKAPRVQLRPVHRATSGVRFVGVDACAPATGSERLRAIGVVAARAVVTGGRACQGVSWVELRAANTKGEREEWGHYLSSPGSAEILRRFDKTAVASAFLDWSDHGRTIAMSDIALTTSMLAIRSIRGHEPSTVRTRKTQLRFAADLSPSSSVDSQVVALTLVNDSSVHRRTVRLDVTSTAVDDLIRALEAVSLQDWLITNMADRLANSPDPSTDAARYTEWMQDHFVHLAPLWKISPPTASLVHLWDALDSAGQLSATWAGLMQEVRDNAMFAILRRLPAVELGNPEDAVA